MRALIQRVASAQVTVDGEVTGRVGAGLCALVGVTHDDGPDEARRLADKVWRLRVLPDDGGVMNRSLADRAAAGLRAEVLVVSQFTLYADTARGRRPSWAAAAPPERAAPLVDAFAAHLAAAGATVASGRFGAHMEVALVNDGPVTLLLEVAPTPAPPASR